MSDDPELRRIAELLVRQRQGRLADAELEELALYLDEQPALVEHARAHLGELVLVQPTGVAEGEDRAWLERVRGDRALSWAKQTPQARIERSLGLALVGAGVVGVFAGVPFGIYVALGGSVLLLGSFLRVRLTTRDPYDQIEQ
jgi:hypothetical protein